MLKKSIALLFVVLALIMCVSCADEQGETPSEDIGKTEVISLTAEEAELLEAMGEDVQIISEADYANAVTELQYHTSSYSGQVFQLEGVLKTASINGTETPFVYRTLNNAGEKTECGLPLKYLEKAIPDGSWVRVTAIINSGDFGGQPYTVMEVVAIEVPAESGAAELNWTGSQHNHEN